LTEFILHIDKQLFVFINSVLANPVLDMLCPFFRNQKNWYLLYAVFAYLLYRQYNFRALYVIAATALLILLSDQVSANLIKNAVQRLRPCNDELFKNQVRLLVNCGKGYSFVSAHASNHFALAVFLSAMLKNISWLRMALLMWAACIAFSQVYVGVHYPADVITGGILGSMLAYVFVKLIIRLLPDLLQPNN
jgi:membrane-associated phospholipid phosphatase